MKPSLLGRQFSFLLIFLPLTCCSPARNHLEDARMYTTRMDYERAIDCYRKHIDKLRLQNSNQENNPSFYLVLIGDLQRESGNFGLALESYQLADKGNVDPKLINDRLWLLAQAMADKGCYNQAINILKDYQPRDPLLYDIALDRLARLAVIQEESQTFADAREDDTCR